MSLLINLPDSFQPQLLSKALKSLDPELQIEIGAENVKNLSAVEFAVDWKNPQGHLLNYPNDNDHHNSSHRPSSSSSSLTLANNSCRHNCNTFIIVTPLQSDPK